MPNGETQQFTPQEFAAKVKAKYPDYANVPDDQLVEKITAKYPQYKSQIKTAPAPTDHAVAKEIAATSAKEDAPISGVYRKIGRGLGLGAAAGAGIPEDTSGLGVVTGALGNFGSGLWETGKAVAKDPIVGGMNVLHGIASGLEKGGGEAYAGLKERDPEKMAHGAGSLLTQILMLKGGKKAATTKLAESELLGAAGKTKLGKLVKDVSESKLSRLEKEHAVQQAVEEATHQKKLAEHKLRVEQMKSEYAQKVQEHSTQSKVASARQAAAGAKTGAALEHQGNLAGLLKENLEITNENIARKLGTEFEAVQEAVEAKKPYFEYKPIADAVKEGRRKLVMPESNKILDNMLGPEAATTGMDYATGRQLYSKLNEYLFAGSDLPSDVYGAVKGVRDALGKQIQASADSVGLGGKFSKAMKDWGEYKSAWSDKSAIAKGGSPIRRILDAEDPGFVIDQLKGKAGERLLEIIGKYGKYGADKALAGRLKGFIERVKEMPSSPGEIPKAPERPQFPSAPEAPSREPFNREVASRQILIDRIKKAAGVGGGVVGAELLYKLLSGGGGGAVPGGH